MEKSKKSFVKLRLPAHGWCQGERRGGNNAVAVSCSHWHAFCNCSVPGTLGFVFFSTPTLSVTLTLSGALKAATWEAMVPRGTATTFLLLGTTHVLGTSASQMPAFNCWDLSVCSTLLLYSSAKFRGSKALPGEVSHLLQYMR